MALTASRSLATLGQRTLRHPCEAQSLEPHPDVGRAGPLHVRNLRVPGSGSPMSFDPGFFAGAYPPVSVHVGCLVRSAPACIVVTIEFPTRSVCE